MAKYSSVELYEFSHNVKRRGLNEYFSGGFGKIFFSGCFCNRSSKISWMHLQKLQYCTMILSASSFHYFGSFNKLFGTCGKYSKGSSICCFVQYPKPASHPTLRRSWVHQFLWNPFHNAETRLLDSTSWFDWNQPLSSFQLVPLVTHNETFVLEEGRILCRELLAELPT